MTETLNKLGKTSWRLAMSETGLLAMQLAEWWEATLIIGVGSAVLTIFTIICWRHIVGKKQS